MHINTFIKSVILSVFVSSCAHNSPRIIHDQRLGVYKVNPRNASYSIEIEKTNPNIINIKSKISDDYSAWVIADETGIKSVQMLPSSSDVRSNNSGLVGAFVMKDGKVQKIKGFKTGIIANNRKETGK